MLKNRKAISPVIATVILVAVAITIAVAVSYWMSGIAGQYTKFEKVEIQSGYSVLQSAGTPPAPIGWIITLELKNSGSATANLIKVFVNDKPVDIYGATGLTGATTPGSSPVDALETGVNFADTGLAIDSGKTASPTVQLFIGSDLFSSGTTIDIKIHSAGGMDYIKLLPLA